MKTKFFKTVLPAFVIMLAVVSAFAFKSVEDKTLLAPETGWVSLPGNPCIVTSIECDNNPDLTEICTVFYQGNMHQAFGKTSDVPLICNRVLYKKPEGN